MPDLSVVRNGDLTSAHHLTWAEPQGIVKTLCGRTIHPAWSSSNTKAWMSVVCGTCKQAYTRIV